MTWVRLDDRFAQHPKVQQAGPLGLALQVAALCYSNQYLTDGFVPVTVVERLLQLDDPHVVAGELVEVGLWKTVDGGWQIHDYEQYQPTREQVLAEREAARERQLKYRKSRRDKRVTHNEQTENQRVTNAEVLGPRTRTSTYVEVGDEQSRSQANDDSAHPTDEEPEPATTSKRVPFSRVNMPASDQAAYVRALIHNGVIVDPVDLDGYDLDDTTRHQLKTQLGG